MSDPGPYRDGKVHVCAVQCSTCVFRSGNLMHLAISQSLLYTFHMMHYQAISSFRLLICIQELSTSPFRLASVTCCMKFWNG